MLRCFGVRFVCFGVVVDVVVVVVAVVVVVMMVVCACVCACVRFSVRAYVCVCMCERSLARALARSRARVYVSVARARASACMYEKVCAHARYGCVGVCNFYITRLQKQSTIISTFARDWCTDMVWCDCDLVTGVQTG